MTKVQQLRNQIGSLSRELSLLEDQQIRQIADELNGSPIYKADILLSDTEALCLHTASKMYFESQQTDSIEEITFDRGFLLQARTHCGWFIVKMAVNGFIKPIHYWKNHEWRYGCSNTDSSATPKEYISNILRSEIYFDPQTGAVLSELEFRDLIFTRYHFTQHAFDLVNKYKI